MNTTGLLQSKWSPKGFTLILQETRSIHDSMNFPKIEFITYIYILYYQSSINFQFSPDLAGFPDILNQITHNVGFGKAKKAKFPRLTSRRYVFNVTQTSVNKQRYWMDLTLARSNARMWVWLKSICSWSYISNVEVHLKARSGNVIQLLTNEALDMMWYRPDNTNIDRGEASLVNNCFII